ncbi:MAG: glycoside hydrolase family 1 protein [Candidatus Omnitrophota bacterium]|jgi:beta-glucosidase
MLKFPHGFLWGAATSSYQVEGNNTDSDWWQWEKETGRENSGQACRHYELYSRDFDLAQGLNHNAHRLSLEWSRIEPEEGKLSEKELQHYIEVILALKQRNLEPMVTLHHFTNPLWLSKSGGWENPGSVAKFLRYSEFVVRALGKYVRYWITINEPNVYTHQSYVIGIWPPQAKSYCRAKRVENNLIAAHIRAYRLIHKIYRELKIPAPSVSIAQNMQAFVPCTPALKNRFAAWLRDKWYNSGFIRRVGGRKTLDFIGLNYYSRQLVDVYNWSIEHLALDTCQNNHHPVKKNSLGWDIYPEGLYTILLKLKKYKLPVIITENGICTPDDNLRWEYIYNHLKNIRLAMEKGVNVAGYLYWSLLDNFEWHQGFAPRFGLIEVDYNNYKRIVRESARKFAAVCKNGVLE